MKVIDPKYHIEGDKIIKTSNGEAILDDEPLILFRARDMYAYSTLLDYMERCITGGCNEHQLKGIQNRIEAFGKFREEHTDRLKVPGITEDIDNGSSIQRSSPYQPW